MRISPAARRRRRIFFTVVGAAVAVLALYVVAVARSGDGVHPGTTVLGVDIGGQSVAQARATLVKQLGPKASGALTVTVDGQPVRVTPKELGLSFDAAATAQAATGRTWNPLALLREQFGSTTVEPVVAVDEARLATRVAALDDAVASPPVEPAITYDGTTPQLTEGQPGRGIDAAATAAAVRAVYLRSSGPVDAPLGPQPPTVSADAARAALAGAATTAVAEPVAVRVGDLDLTLAPRDIAAALSFAVRDGALVPVLDGARLHAALGPRLAAQESPGRDASFVIERGRPVVVPAKVGTGVSDDELARAVAGVLDATGGDRTVTVAIGRREPALTTEQAKGLGITEMLSTFTQRFPYAAYRVQNIGQAATFVNGTVLRPGEVFSMNKVARERTTANGYTKGFVVGPGGIFKEDLGGGVSTATTALWTAAFFAGLERVETRAHSIYISRYKPGLEATVAYGSFDMRFRNDTGHGVLITAGITRTSVTVTIWGTRVYDDVRAEFGERRNVRPYKEVYDTSPECHAQGGSDGFTIDVDRVFFTAGAEVKRETITTTYQPSPRVHCGEDPAKASPSPSASGSATGSTAPPADGEPTVAPSPAGTPTTAPAGTPSAKPTAASTAKPTAASIAKPTAAAAGRPTASTRASAPGPAAGTALP